MTKVVIRPKLIRKGCFMTTEGRSLIARTYDVQYISSRRVPNCHLQKYMKSDAHAKITRSATVAENAKSIDDSASDDLNAQSQQSGFWIGFLLFTVLK